MGTQMRVVALNDPDSSVERGLEIRIAEKLRQLRELDRQQGKK